MAYDTWSWDKDSGTGNPSGLHLERLSPNLTQSTEAGYLPGEAAGTRDRWFISIEFARIRPQGWMYLTEFFHSHRGGAEFYWRYPFGIWGAPEGFGTADPGGLTPFQSEDEPGFGLAPLWLVQFNPKLGKLGWTRVKSPDNYFATKYPIELITL